MEPNIKISYIQCFYINDQQYDSSLLCIEFQILHCKSWLKIGLKNANSFWSLLNFHSVKFVSSML